jgi:hypothetical protein
VQAAGARCVVTPIVKSTVAWLILSLAMTATAAAQPGQTPPPSTPPSHAEPEPGPAEPKLTLPEPRQAEPKLTLPEPRQAEPKLTPPEASQAEPTPTQPLPGDERSEGVALGLSVGGTVASWAMIGAAVAMDRPGNDTAASLARVGLVGAVLAPSFGHWYAGTFATRGLGLRLAGLGLTTLAVVGVIVMCEDECTPTIPEALLIAGAGLTIVGTLDDIATAPRDVRRHNQRLYGTSIVPVVHRDSRSVGLSITGRF